MFKVEANIRLAVRHSLVYDILLDMENYPAVFPFYIETNRIAHDIWAIKALMRNGIFSEHGKPFEWETQFWEDSDEYIIKTSELGAKFPLKRLTASWKIVNQGEYTDILLGHEFEITNFVLTKYLFYPIVSSVVKQNSKRLLDCIEKYLNKKR